MTTYTLFIRHQDGHMSALSGRRLTKLLRDLRAGRGGEFLTSLLLNGYEETLGGIPLSTEDTCALIAEAEGRFTA